MVARASLLVPKRGDEDTSSPSLKYPLLPSALLGPNATSQLAYTNCLGQTIGFSCDGCKNAFGHFLFIYSQQETPFLIALSLISLLIYYTSLSLEVFEFLTSS